MTDHNLPDENEHWVSPAYLARIREGEPVNMEPEKTLQVKWFALSDVPAPLTMTARAAISALGSCITAS